MHQMHIGKPTEEHARPSAYLRTRQPELGEANSISEQDASNGSHGPASVGLLALSQPSQRLGVLAQSQGVEPAAATANNSATQAC